MACILFSIRFFTAPHYSKVRLFLTKRSQSVFLNLMCHTTDIKIITPTPVQAEVTKEAPFHQSLPSKPSDLKTTSNVPSILPSITEGKPLTAVIPTPTIITEPSPRFITNHLENILAT